MWTFKVSLIPPHPVLVSNDSQANILSLQLDIIRSLRAWAFAPTSCVHVVGATGQVCAYTCTHMCALPMVCVSWMYICLDVSCQDTTPGSPISNWVFPSLVSNPTKSSQAGLLPHCPLSDTDSFQLLGLCLCNSLHQNALPAPKSHPPSALSSNCASSRKHSLP